MIAKIYQNQFSTSVIAVIDEINDLNIDLNINWGSRWNLVLPFWDYDLKPYNKIEFFEVKNGSDILVFSWYIYNVIINLTWYTIEIRDENDLMNKKLVLNDKTYTSKTPWFILNDISSEWQTETTENWQVVSSVSDTITIDFKKWDTFYSVLNELSQQLNYNWLVKWQTIYFDEVVAEDKSTWPLFEELVYNGLDNSETNISDLTLEYYGNIANLIIGGDTTTKVLKKDLDNRGAIWEYTSFNEWDLNTQTQEILDLKKWELFNFSITPELYKTDINLWDKIYLRIEEAPNSKLNYTWNIIVNKVRFEYTNATIIKSIEVEISVIKKNLLSNRLEMIERNLNLLLKK
jgi:hypothetical protein